MTGPRVERKLAAILAADVAGFSRLMSADEAATANALRENRAAIDEIVESHRGRIVKSAGDGLLLEFPSVVAAVECGIGIQRVMAQRNEAIPEERRMLFRIGINIGDVLIEGDDILGDGVNVAARLETMAEVGGICLSEDAYRQVQGKVAANFVDMGERTLKNIARPMRVYRVEIGGRGEARADAPHSAAKLETGRVRLALPDMPSIAVLPFTNMSGDPEQEYFADGVVEDIITGLSRIKWLFVIARNSSFIYKGRAVDVKQVGRELGVRYVLEGGIRKAGHRIRVTAQLIEAETGIHLWADRYDRSLHDIFAVQDEITISVIGAIEPNLRKAEIERVKRQRPDSLDAYDLTLRALPHVYTAMPEDAALAMPLLAKALELDPAYAAAHAHLAWCHHQRFSRAGLRTEDRAAAIRHARAAMSHGGDDATALAIAGFVISLDEHDHATALDLFDRAIALSATNVFALRLSAVVLAWMGRTEAAIDRAERALRLNPFDSLGFLPNIALAVSCFQTGRYGDSANAARLAVESNPRFSVPHALLAAALVRLGRDEEAKTAARSVLSVQPNFSIREFGVTVGLAAPVFAQFADAWRAAGLPE